MEYIDQEQLKNVKGGGINLKMMAGIGALASFFVGIIDGWFNPKKCNN